MNVIEDLPLLCLEIILQDFCVESHSDVPTLSLVSKRFREAVDQNKMWRTLTEKRFVFLQNASDVKDWKEFYKRRHTSLSNARDAPIENCIEWEFKCPIAMSRLTRTMEKNVDMCNVCNEKVFICNSVEEVASHVAQKQCVAYAPAELMIRNRPKPQIMGRMVLRR